MNADISIGSPSVQLPRCAIIVVTYNSAGTIRACLERLVGLQDAAVIVVDNNSADDTKSLLAQQFPLVRVISLPENVGFGAACNIGVAAATAPFILLLNPDVVASPDDLMELVEFLEQRPCAAITGGRLIDPSGHPLQSMGDRPSLPGLIIDKPLALLARAAGRKGALRWLLGSASAKYRLPDNPLRVAWVSGAALCCRREVWEQLDGFDEGFFMYYEDVDFCIRAGELSLETWHLPKATFIHRSGTSWHGKEQLKREAYYHSRCYFFEKHSSPLVLALVRTLEVFYKVTRGYRWFSREVVGPAQHGQSTGLQ